MKKGVVGLLICCSFFACDKVFKKQEDFTRANDTVPVERVEGEQDAHGCIPSAGYTWSHLKQDCLRIFEEGYRLNPIDTLSEDKVVLGSAFILYNEDKTKVELFISSEKEGVVLEKKDKNTFEFRQYLFNQESFALYINNVKKYEAAKTELKNITDIDNEGVVE